LDEIQAAMLSVKLKFLDQETIQRRKVAEQYIAGINNPQIILPLPAHSKATQLTNHVWHLFVIRTNKRELLTKHLTEMGIQTLIHYPLPPHQQMAYKEWNQEVFSVSEAIHRQVLSIPIGPTMTDLQVSNIIAALNGFK